jgi:hypothetical protein
LQLKSYFPLRKKRFWQWREKVGASHLIEGDENFPEFFGHDGTVGRRRRVVLGSSLATLAAAAAVGPLIERRPRELLQRRQVLQNAAELGNVSGEKKQKTYVTYDLLLLLLLLFITNIFRWV